MSYKYLLIKDSQGRPPLYALFGQNLSHDKVFDLIADAARYEGVMPESPSAGTILWNEKDDYKTLGFSMKLDVRANPEDGPHIGADFKKLGRCKFLTMGEHIVLLNRWPITTKEDNKHFCNTRDLTYGKVLFGLETEGESKFFKVSGIEIQIPRELNGDGMERTVMKDCIEWVLNTN